MSLVSDLKRDEGLRLKPYRCSAGKLTIGYGRNLEDVGITQAEAEAMLMADIKAARRELDRVLPWWRNLSAVRQDALVNMAFNLGITRLLGFKNALAAMQAYDFDRAADEMLDSRWAAQVGDRAKRLAHMMRAGRRP